MAARSGTFRGGLRPFGGGTLDANAAFAMPEPPAPVAPPARVTPPPRGHPRQAPKPVVPRRKATQAVHPAGRPPSRRQIIKPPTRPPVRPKPPAAHTTARRPPPKPPVTPIGVGRNVQKIAL